MYLIQGPPTVYRLTQPSPAEGEAVLSVAINPAGSLIAVVSTHRLSVWSGGSKHVVLGSEPIGLSCLAGVSALWKRDSSVLAAITKRGRLLLCEVAPRGASGSVSAASGKGASKVEVGAGEGLLDQYTLPDWLEEATAEVGDSGDIWERAPAAELSLLPDVTAIHSKVTAICHGRFGQHIMVGTACGSIHTVSWSGDLLRTFSVETMANALSDGAGTAAFTSLSFSDTLQLLAYSTANGGFGLCTLSGSCCFKRQIPILQQNPTPMASPSSSPPLSAGRRGHPDRSHFTARAPPSLALPMVTGASLVAFSDVGNLLAVGLEDGAVLLTRVERHTSGARSHAELKVRNGMLSRQDSYQFSPVSSQRLREGRGNSFSHASSSPAGTGTASGNSSAYGNGSAIQRQDSAGSIQSDAEERGTRKGSFASLWGVEIHHLNSLSQALGSRQKVLSLGFSRNGNALAIGHSKALSVWSAEDGTRLTCTLAEREEESWPGVGAARAGGLTSCSSSSTSISSSTTGLGGSGKGIRSMAWGSQGYKLFTVSCSGTLESLSFVRDASSSVSTACMCLQSIDRVLVLDSHPWDSCLLQWRVLPVHRGYIGVNGPLRHVSSSRSCGQLAVAGRRGIAICNVNQERGRWRLFGNIAHERELQVCGLCWWGEDAVLVLCQEGSAHWLRLYPRTHLDSSDMLLEPIKLPLGMKPYVLSCVAVGSRFDVLVAGTTSYALYRLSFEGKSILQGGPVAAKSVNGGTLPHAYEGGAGSSLAPVGPPKQLFLLPEVHPPSLALLDYSGVLATLQVVPGSGSDAALESEGGRDEERVPCQVVAVGVSSITDLSKGSWRWQTEAQSIGVHPCYLLHRKQSRRIDRDEVEPWACGEALSVWMPAIRLAPLPSSVQSLLEAEPVLTSGGDGDNSSGAPLLALDPEGSARDAECLSLGIHPRLGTMVKLSQVVCRSRAGASADKSGRHSFSSTPCYETLTQLRPILHIVLRYLLFVGQLQAQEGRGDWCGGDGDAFEVAQIVLEHCRDDPDLYEPLSDALELLVRACLEAKHISVRRALKSPDGAHDLALASGVLQHAVHLCQLMVQPAHLLHESLRLGKLTTAAWYLPLVRDNITVDALPRCMGRLLGSDWPHGLTHALCCCLLWQCLGDEAYPLLPEVWSFARKREESVPMNVGAARDARDGSAADFHIGVAEGAASPPPLDPRQKAQVLLRLASVTAWDSSGGDALYNVPLARDAAAVLSRFIWERLNEGKVSAVQAISRALVSPAHGLMSGDVLAMVKPAQRSVVGTTLQPEEIMNRLWLGLAEMLGVSEAALPEAALDPHNAQELRPVLEVSRLVHHWECSILCGSLLQSDERGVAKQLQLCPANVLVGYANFLGELGKGATQGSSASALGLQAFAVRCVKRVARAQSLSPTPPPTRAQMTAAAAETTAGAGTNPVIS